MAPQAEDLNVLARHLKSLHIPGEPLILTNIWDAATASWVASLPQIVVIATASYAIGASIGLKDENKMTLSQNLESLSRIMAGVHLANKADTLPVTADLQDGYVDPAVAVRKVLELGIVGCNIEDVDNTHESPTLRPMDESARRIKVAVDAAKAAGVPDFVVNARTDVLGHGGSLVNAIERGRRYLEAGATTAFVWGAMKYKLSVADVKRLVTELDGRVSVLAQGLTVAELRRCGVSRISVGPALHWRVKKLLRDEVEALYEGNWSM
jgi:2-methylisocitrate lyase-like PEP mutase family enzyme